MYRLCKSKGDGHCALYSIMSCLGYIFRTDLSIFKLMQNIIDECQHSTSKYICHYAGSEFEFLQEVILYILAKQYRSAFCDVLPAVISNSLNIEVIIVNHVNVNVNVYSFLPDGCVDAAGHCTKCNHPIGSIVLYRRPCHYDACLPVTRQSTTLCTCFIMSLSSVPILDEAR